MILTGIGGGLELEHNMALAYFKCIAAGMPPGGINSAFRSHDRQVWEFNDNYTSNYAASGKRDRRPWDGINYWRRVRKVSNGASTVSVAVPGTSNHEFGIAFDLDTPQQLWMRVHGAGFGFINPDWAKQSATYEPWHWEHTTTGDPHTNATAAVEKKETDMSLIIRTKQHGIYTVELGKVYCHLDTTVAAGLEFRDKAEVYDVAPEDLESILLALAACPKGSWPAPGEFWVHPRLAAGAATVGADSPSLVAVAEAVADELDRRAAARLSAVKDA